MDKAFLKTLATVALLRSSCAATMVSFVPLVVLALMLPAMLLADDEQPPMKIVPPDDAAAIRAFADAGATMRKVIGPGRVRYVTEIVLSADERVPRGLLSNLKSLSKCTDLFLSGKGITDAELEEVADVSHIERLHLARTSVTEDALKTIARLKGLKHLSVSGTRIGDDGLKSLVGLKQLESLNLSGTQVTDQGLKHIAMMKGLRELQLLKLDISSEGLLLLADLDKLETVALDSPRISLADLDALEKCDSLQYLAISIPTMEGAAKLKALTKLKGLEVRVAVMNDEALAHIAQMQALQILTFTKANVSERGMGELSTLKTLRRINLPSGKIDVDAIRSFHKTRP